MWVLVEEYDMRELARDGSLAGPGEWGWVVGMGTGEGEWVICGQASL